jgi:hypothetical protein
MKYDLFENGAGDTQNFHLLLVPNLLRKSFKKFLNKR